MTTQPDVPCVGLDQVADPDAFRAACIEQELALMFGSPLTSDHQPRGPMTTCTK